MPSHDATSGSASKVTEFVVPEIVGPVPIVRSSPPITLIPAPWEKISTGPRLPSITSVESLRTTTPAATGGSSRPAAGEAGQGGTQGAVRAPAGAGRK